MFGGERAVGRPDFEDGADGEECGGVTRSVGVGFVVYARHADGVGEEFARDGEVGWFGTEEIIYDGPGGDWPTVVDLCTNVRSSAGDERVTDCMGICMSAYLPDERTSCVFPSSSLPVSSP